MVFLALLPLLVGVEAASAAPQGSAAASQAHALCRRADELNGRDREAALAEGRALAEAALDADDDDALAHLAFACNLGKQMAAAGVGVGQLIKLSRLRQELRTALDLAPGDADVLVANGALLVELPRILGGDPEVAEGLLRRALAADPDNGTARCYLARVLNARGADAETDAQHSGC